MLDTHSCPVCKEDTGKTLGFHGHDYSCGDEFPCPRCGVLLLVDYEENYDCDYWMWLTKA
jgi:hypothetical protein